MFKKWFNKQTVSAFILGVLVFSALPVKAAIEEFICYKADYKLVIYGQEFNDPDLPLMNYKGYTVGSVRKILEAARIPITWNAELKQAEVVEPDISSETSNVGGADMSDAVVATNENPLMIDTDTKAITIIELSGRKFGIDNLPVYNFTDTKYVNAFDIERLIKKDYSNFSFSCNVKNGDCYISSNSFPSQKIQGKLINISDVESNFIFIDYATWTTQILPMLKGE